MHVGEALTRSSVAGEFLLVRRSHILVSLLVLILVIGALVLYGSRRMRELDLQRSAELTQSEQRFDECASEANERVDELKANYELQIAGLNRQLTRLAGAMSDLQQAEAASPASQQRKGRVGGGLAPIWPAAPAPKSDCSCPSGSVGPEDILNALADSSHTSGASAWTELEMHASRPPRVVFLIPTVPRGPLGHLDYLAETLRSLTEQSLDSHFSSCRIVVMNHMPNRHPVFDKMKALYALNPLFDFVDNTQRLLDPYSDKTDPDDWDNPDDRPGHAVRQQSCDLISLFSYGLKHYGDHQYFLLMEDDFPLCESAGETLRYVINKATSYRGDWNAIRTSYGANGIIFPTHLLSSLIEYMTAKLVTKPPDHLITQWMCGATLARDKCTAVRQNFVFRWNLFKHIGTQSSLRETGWLEPPGCWYPYSDLMWQVDGFQESECPNDDIWPCNRNGIKTPEKSFQLLDLYRFAYHQHWIAETQERFDDGLVRMAFHSRAPQELLTFPYNSANHTGPLFILLLATFVLYFALLPSVLI